MAVFGFHGRVSSKIDISYFPSLLLAIGVDLGTTFSVVGVRMGGKVKIIEDQDGRVIFPSVVSYLENGGFFSFVFNIKCFLRNSCGI